MSRFHDLVAKRDRKEHLISQVFDEARVTGGVDLDFNQFKCLGKEVKYEDGTVNVTAVSEKVSALQLAVMDLNTQIEALGGAKHMGLQRMLHADPSGAHRTGKIGGRSDEHTPELQPLMRTS